MKREATGASNNLIRRECANTFLPIEENGVESLRPKDGFGQGRRFTLIIVFSTLFLELMLGLTKFRMVGSH